MHGSDDLLPPANEVDNERGCFAYDDPSPCTPSAT
jgi:hypothetical protein